MLLKIKEFVYTRNGFQLRLPALEEEIGKIVSLVGPNASGKSTFLSLIAGLLDHSVPIFYSSVPMSSLSFRQLSFRRSILLQNESITVPFRVESFLEMAWEGERDISREEKLISSFEIEPLLHRKITHLSGGEVQRVRLVRTLLRPTPLILLDEPTNHLDLYFTKKLKEFLCEIKKDHLIFIASHWVRYLSEITDEWLIFDKGNIETAPCDASLLCKKLSEIFKVPFFSYEGRIDCRL